MAKDRLTGKLAVILHADVVGSTILVQRDEQLAHQRIQDSFRRFSDVIEKYHGRVQELRGDALLAEFERASDAVTAALSFQHANCAYLAEFNDDIQPQIRVGIALGEVVIADSTVTGAGVVLAQRIEQIAEPGGLCITSAIHEALPDRMPFSIKSIGEHALKGFEEPVRVYRVQLSPGESIPAPQLKTRSRESSRFWQLTATIAVVVVTIATGVGYWSKSIFQQEQPASLDHLALKMSDKPSIAVLPFINMSGDAEQEYFVDGMTEDLITDLSKISDLFVISRNSSFSFKGKQVKVQQVARELGVRYVLEGSVRRMGDQLRFNAQLIDATSGGHLWAERYDSSESDVFQLQDRVIREIVASLKVNLTDSENNRLSRLPTANLEAYDYYKRAEHFYQSFRPTEMGMAIVLYQKALQLDSNFADAYAGHGQAAWYIWRVGADHIVPGPVARKMAYESASKALQADQENSRAFAVLAALQSSEGQHQQALDSARRSINLAPSNAWSYANLAMIQVAAGLPSEADAAMQIAFRLEPKPPPWFYTLKARVLFFNHRFEESFEYQQKGVPAGSNYHRWLAMTYAQLGEIDKARSSIERLFESAPFDSIARTRTRYAHYKRKEDLELLLESLRKGGLPEWPFGFNGNEKNRLDEKTVSTLSVGKTWTGYSQNGGKFVQQFTQEGQVALRSSSVLLTGIAWNDKGMLCIRYPALDMGRASCGFIFINPEGIYEDKNEYIYLNASDVSYFSVKP